jgi:hypothetical protein
MNVLHPASLPCCKSELDLFNVQPTQTSIEDSNFTQINPVNSISSENSPIEFIISSSGELLLDPSDIFLYVKVKLQHADGSEFPEKYPVYPESNFIHTMFNQCDVYLNQQNISTSANNYAYRAFLETTLNFTKDAKDTHLTAGMYYTENERNNIANIFANSKSKQFDCFAKLHGDIFHQDKLLINGVDMRIKLSRSSPTFCLNVKGIENAAIKPIQINILESYLYVRRVKLSAHRYLQMENELLRTSAKYPIRRIETKMFTIAPGISNKNLPNVVIGNLPQRVIIGMLNHKSVNGSYDSSSIKFEHFDVRKVALYRNGISVGKALQPIFSKDDLHLNARAYLNMFTSLGMHGDSSNGISSYEYASSANLYPFDLTPDLSANSGSHVNPVKQGHISL